MFIELHSIAFNEHSLVVLEFHNCGQIYGLTKK
jgi:hypothetical protein